MQIKKITTMADALEALESFRWSLWAVLPPTVMTHHWMVVTPAGIREVDGQLQVNMIEFDYATESYKGEDWRTPLHVYVKHQCDGCHYPPDMCCNDDGSEDILFYGRYTTIELG